MNKERFEQIKENVYTRCNIANYSGIGLTLPDREELELIEGIERLHSIIKEVREYVKENTTSYYTNIEETNEEFELICNPEELLEILKKVDKEI